MCRRLLFPMCAIFLALSVAFGILEAGLRFTTNVPITATALNMFFQTDPQTGWHGIPNVKSRFRTISFDCLVEHDAEGFRKVSDPETTNLSRDDRPEIWVIGDSMTWGWGVNNGETFVDYLAMSDPGHRYRNFSAPGFSTLQESLLIRKLLEHKSAPAQLLLVFCNNDLSENVAYRDQDPPRPYWEVNGETLHLRNFPAPPVGWFRPHAWMKSHSRAYNYLHYCAITLRQRWKANEMPTPGNMPEPLNDEQWTAQKHSLNAISELCHSYGTRVTIVCLPMDDGRDSKVPAGVLRQQRDVSARVASMAEAAHMQFWDLQDDFYRLVSQKNDPQPIRFRYDPHFTAKGHACLGEALTARIAPFSNAAKVANTLIK